MEQGRLPERQPEAVVRLDQFGSVVDKDAAEHDGDFGAHEN